MVDLWWFALNESASRNQLICYKKNNIEIFFDWRWHQVELRVALIKESLLFVENLKTGIKNMKKYKCKLCGHIYDEAQGDARSGVAPGTAWADLPDDWECPKCGAIKIMFIEMK